MIEIDATDRRILAVLQRDGRMTNADLASAVGLSASACHRRVQRLEEVGVIRGYVALLDARKLERPTTVFVEITLAGQADELLEAFERAVRTIPDVLECHLMAGDCDFLLRVAVADLDAYRQFQMQHLNRIAGVQNTKTEIPMQRIKQTTQLPL